MAWRQIPQAAWRAMPSVHRARPDPYCIWAELTNWAHYAGPDTAPSARPPWFVRVALCLWGRVFGPPYEEGCGPDLANPVQRAVIVELVNANVGTAESFLARCTFPHLLVPGIYQPS